MQKLKNIFARASNGFRNVCAKTAIVGGAALAPALSHAQLNLTDVETSLQGASDTGLTVGGYVIAAVAALVVIGVIIGIVKKL